MGTKMNYDAQDIVQFSAQMGRLDLVSLLLAAIGLILVLGGLFAFMNFRAIAKNQASLEAKAVAEKVAERVANEYLQREMPNVIAEYREFVANSNVTGKSADLMATSQDEE